MIANFINRELNIFTLHGRIPDATDLNGTETETDALPVVFSGRIISIQASLRKPPVAGSITLMPRLNQTEIIGGDIVFPSGETQLTRKSFPTSQNIAVEGMNFNFLYVESNTTPQSVEVLEQVEGVGKITILGGHGFTNGQVIEILGANEDDWDGFHKITVANSSQFVFLVGPDIQTPATGTITVQSRPIIPINYSVLIQLD